MFGNWLVPYATKIGLNDWDFIAVSIAIASLIVACGAYISQSKTERNTMKITEEGQFDLLVDYVRHAYANLVVVKAIYSLLSGYPKGFVPTPEDFKERMSKRMRTHYPSEEHLRKLTVDTEALHPEAFVHTQDKYSSIHNLLLLVRNYNIETEVAEKHLCDPNVAPRFKDRDLNTLIFKQNLFCARFMRAIRILCGPTYSRWDRFRLNPPRVLGMFRRTEEAVRAKYAAKTERRHEVMIDKVRETILNEAVGRDDYEDEEAKLSRDEKIALLRTRETGEYFTDEEKEANNFFSLIFKEPETEKKAPEEMSEEDKKREEERNKRNQETMKMFFDLLNRNVYYEIHGDNSQHFKKIAILTFAPEDDPDDTLERDEADS